MTDHLFNVRRESIHSVYPAYSGGFHEDDEEYGQARSVDVQQIDQVNAPLEVREVLILFYQNKMGVSQVNLTRAKWMKCFQTMHMLKVLE
jgi:hypothetical protein